MTEYVPPRYNDPNYLGFDDFEKQLLKRGIVESYYEQAYAEQAGEAYIKAANQQAFRYSEARRAVADALGTRHVIPAADTVVPQSAPGVLSSTGARAVAAAAGSSGAQAARALKTAAEQTVMELASKPTTLYRAIPQVGAVAGAVIETTNSRNAGRSWGESVSRGLGAAIGGTVGGNLGLAGGAAAGLNPIPSAAAAVGGSIAGGAVGAAAGGAAYGNARRPFVVRNIPGTSIPFPTPALPWIPPGLLGPLPNPFGREDRGPDLPAENPTGKNQDEDTTTIPPFPGGQSPVPYYVYISVCNIVTGVRAPERFAGAFNGPVSQQRYGNPDCSGYEPGSVQTVKGYKLVHANGELIYGNTPGCFIYDSSPQVRVDRADGQPDTGGNQAGGEPTTVPRPQVAPRPNSPIYNPPPAQPGNTPPGSSPQSPEEREGGGKPFVPPINPAGSPAPSPVPPIAPAPVTPNGNPSTVPNQSSSTTPAGSSSTSSANATPEVDTNKETDTITIGNPEGSNQIFKIPGHPDLRPGETVELEDTESNRAISRAIYAALTGAVIGGGILAAKKIAEVNQTSTDPIRPPNAPPPQNPPDSGCRCNNPVLSKLDDFEKKLGLNNIVSGAGDASVMAYLQKMQAFAEKAWEMSRIQKVLNALTLITVLHNASMISRDVGETLGYALSQGLDVLGIDDEEGNALDVNSWFGTQANNFFENIFGADRWHGLNEFWNKANRIISSATMIVWTLRSIHDGTQEVLEWTAENTGKIGNALKKWGVVGERAYPWMAERVKAQDQYRRKFSRILDGLETVEETASSYAMVTSEINEITQEVAELGAQRQRFTESVRDMAPDSYPDNSPFLAPNENAGTNARSGPEVTPVDMEPGSNGTP